LINFIKIKNSAARSNWHLFYTLINNEELRHYRKHSVKMQRLDKKINEKVEELSICQKLSNCFKKENRAVTPQLSIVNVQPIKTETYRNSEKM
jgi:hypothetical protein